MWGSQTFTTPPVTEASRRASGDQAPPFKPEPGAQVEPGGLGLGNDIADGEHSAGGNGDEVGRRAREAIPPYLNPEGLRILATYRCDPSRSHARIARSGPAV